MRRLNYFHSLEYEFLGFGEVKWSMQKGCGAMKKCAMEWKKNKVKHLQIVVNSGGDRFMGS